MHGGDGGVERLGDLVGMPAEHVPQEQHGPRPRLEMLQRGDERQPDLVAGGNRLGRVGVVGGDDPAIRDGRHPRRLGEGQAQVAVAR